MHILIVANGYPPTAVGGVETYTAELSRYLARQGHQVTVFCRESDFSRPDYEITTEQNEQVKIIRVVNDYKQAHSFRQTILDERVEHIFDTVLETEQPDLIHFNHLIALSARLPLVAAKHKIPSVSTLHDFWMICHRVNLIDWRGHICPGPLHGVNCAACVVGGTLRQKASQVIGKAARLLKRFLPAALRRKMRTAFLEDDDQPPALASSPEIFTERLALFTEAVLSTQRILVPSEYVRSQFVSNGIPFERIEILPLGIDQELQHQIPQTPSNILTFAAIGPIQSIKGMDILVKAFRLVSGENIRLKIFGRTDLFPRNHVRRVIELAQADPRISIMGPFDPTERASIYASFDVLIVPSRAPETFSFVTREALMLGKPVIASRIGAIPEIVQNGLNGFLFEAGNHAELAKIIQSIAFNPGILEKLTVPGRLPIHTVAQHAHQIQDIYRQVIERNSNTALKQ